MGDFLLGLGYRLLDSSIKRMLSGAGLSLAMATAIYKTVNSMVNEVIQNLSSAPALLLNFLGASGVDVALSLVVGALLGRATIEQARVFLTKV